MTSAQRRLLEGISRRANALARAVDTALATDQYIEPIVAMIAGNLTRTVFALCGRRLQEDILRWMVNSVRDAHNICLCGRMKVKVYDPLCAICMAQGEADDRKADIYAQIGP